MTTQSTVFQAIDYVVDLCKANVATGVYVYDGPATGVAAERIQVMVAYNDDEGAPAVDGQAETSNFGFPMERYTIDCSISIEDGDTNLRSKRAEVKAIFDVLAGAVRADRTLGGLIKLPGLAEITGFVYTQDQFEAEGSGVVAAFSVSVTDSVLW